VTLIASWLVRWIGFVALAGVIGGFVVDRFLLPAAAPVTAGTRRRLRALRAGCAVLLLLAAGGELWLRAGTMSDGGPGAALRAVPSILTRTHYGSVWIVRAAGLLAVLALSRAASRSLRGLGALAALGVVLTVCLTGHAGDWGDLSPTAGIDWIHVVAATTWTGGLFVLAALVLRDGPRWPAALLGDMMRRFSALAAWCLLAVVLSGAYASWVQLPSVAALWQTVYGRVLVAKLVLVLGLVWWGAVNRYTVLPRLGAGRASSVLARLFRLGRLTLIGSSRVAHPALPSRLAAYVTREAVLAALVFACSAVLGESTPARHARHLERHAAWEEPVRVTMADLHAGGGVPRGWSFTPPAGDAARGRQVFLRSGCFACHAVAGEPFPPSSGAGPDLTGAGEHHPAGYLLESVINPNAVIVQGSGYTGPDGLSIMPSYADRLAVREALDLVAYLRTL
jgi:putative copper export protein/mono/diheme cytochrome c family protein